MLLPEIKEREYRFRLALRMGLPIFALILAFISATLISNYDSLQLSFYIGSLFILTVAIYFIFYLLYRDSDVRIIEPVSRIFTREYLYNYLEKDMKKHKEYTFILISIDNLHHINKRYGIKNGDKVIFEVAKYLGEYLQDKQIYNFPLGHINGADFLVGIEGQKAHHNSMLELLCLKSDEFKVDEIEVNILGAITDTNFSQDIDQMVEHLFEIQEDNRSKKKISNPQLINPSDLESFVIDAIKSESLVIFKQNVFERGESAIVEYFCKLKTHNGKILHPKNYMKVVDRLGLSAEHDMLVLEKSIAHTICCDDEIFAIHISPSSLRNHQFLSKAKELVRDNPELKNRIIFILNEMQYYSHTQRYNAILQSLRKIGVLIALDRIGAIHTSFLYFRDLDIDIIRFDSFYTKDIKNRKHHSIIEGFNVMAHSRGVKTWMKMVENQEILQMSNTIGIDYIQGKKLAPLTKIYED